MEIEPEQIIYERTHDPNIVRRYRLDVTEVYRDKLKRRIGILRRRIQEGQRTPWRVEKLAELKRVREEIGRL